MEYFRRRPGVVHLSVTGCVGPLGGTTGTHRPSRAHRSAHRWLTAGSPVGSAWVGLFSSACTSSAALGQPGAAAAVRRHSIRPGVTCCRRRASSAAPLPASAAHPSFHSPANVIVASSVHAVPAAPGDATPAVRGRPPPGAPARKVRRPGPVTQILPRSTAGRPGRGGGRGGGCAVRYARCAGQGRSSWLAWRTEMKGKNRNRVTAGARSG